MLILRYSSCTFCFCWGAWKKSVSQNWDSEETRRPTYFGD